MLQTFWLRPGRIAGRCGPNLYPWIPRDLARGGIAAVLSVNDGMSVYADDLAAVGIDHACFPMSDIAPPAAGDLEACQQALPAALEFLLRNLAAGKATLIHCTAGKDRTGLMMCYYLCRAEGFTPEDAIDEVKRVRPIALTAPGYEDFAREILHGPV